MDENKIYEFASDFGIPIIRTKSHEILKEIVEKNKPQNILEIGTAIGFSGSIMLEASENSKLFTIEHNKKYARLAKKLFRYEKVQKRVKILLGDCNYLLAKMVLSKKYDEYFDFIFLDGPKAQYNFMLENLIFLLKPGGSLLADNVSFHGQVNNQAKKNKRYETITKRLNTFIENLKNHSQISSFEFYDIEDGMILIKKKKQN